MNDFTASNGVTVIERSTHITVRTPGGTPYIGNGVIGHAFKEYVDHKLATAQAEEGERRNWWRWSGNDDFVVYRWSINHVNVLYLHDGTSQEFSRDEVEKRRPHSFVTDYERAARDWFDAHPEPKPWHNAKPGEVWVVTTENVADEVAVRAHICNETLAFEYINSVSTRFDVTDPRFKAGRRIWPEPDKETS